MQSRRITVNGYFERVTESGATTDKHYIRAGSKVIAIHDRKSDFLHETNHLHRDHLGSVDTITDDDGNVGPRMSFDAFGLRRNALDWTDGFPTNTELEQIRDVTSRGYTGHQMIDAVKLIHMNGRVYDPELGRFPSPDPNIPEPGNTQAFNRYAYVYNNPLSYTDPSGFVAKQEQPTAEQIREAWEELTPKEKEELRRRREGGQATTVRVCNGAGQCKDYKLVGSDVTKATIKSTTQVQSPSPGTQALSNDDKFVAELDRATGEAALDSADYSNQEGILYDRSRANTELGSIIRKDKDGYSHTRADPEVPTGREFKGGGDLVGTISINDATAVVVVTPSFHPPEQIMRDADIYISLSKRIDAPVFVSTSGRFSGHKFLFDWRASQ